jgi:hypothetical protein
MQQADYFLAYEETTLRDAVLEMQHSGSSAKVVQVTTGFIMTQMSAKAGIKKHGQVTVDALYSEFLQLHDLEVFKGLQASELTKAQRNASLRAISVVKEKRCGRIKGRTVADGRPKKGLYTKEETTSPTVSTDALMLSILIEAWKQRDVVLRIEGESVDIMCRVSKHYEQFVTYKNGGKVLYLQLLKPLYGCVKSALLWYELFTGTLQKLGFVLNDYDPCIANMVINGKQCTIAWYVDDNKISHMDPEVVTGIIQKIEEPFGEMTVTVNSRVTQLPTYHSKTTHQPSISAY